MNAFPRVESLLERLARLRGLQAQVFLAISKACVKRNGSGVTYREIESEFGGSHSPETVPRRVRELRREGFVETYEVGGHSYHKPSFIVGSVE